MLLEIASFSLSAALVAEKAGADRIELCENPLEGGTTPSYGTLKRAINKLAIPVFPIIRPRGGDFLYNTEEYEIMKTDLLLCKELDFKGAVLGLLNKDGSIDVERTSRLVELAYPLEITFHRAFDRTVSPLLALEEVVKTGCSRILTSGQKPNVGDAYKLIEALIEKATQRIIILPGSGVRSSNIAAIMQTGATEFHSSARKEIPSAMQYTVATMNETLISYGVDEQEVRNMQTILHAR